MIHLLKLEWMKFRRLPAFNILLYGFFLLLPCVMLVFKQLPSEANTPAATMLSREMFFRFPTTWGFLGYVGNWITFFFLGFIGVIISTLEFSYKTLRQNIITGLSRQNLFFAKLLFMVAISLAFTLYYLLAGMTIGWMHTEVDSARVIFGSTGPAYIWRFFLMCMGYISLGFFFGILTRRTGLSIFLYLIYGMFIELFLRYVLHMEIARNASAIFYPVNSINYLMPFPMGLEMTKEMSRELGFSLVPDPWQAAIAVGVYMLLIYLACYRMLSRQDL